MRKIILASGSPRRQNLLRQMGVTFSAIPSDFNEQLDETRSPDEVAKELGLGKARTVAERYPDALVIGSDTIVSLDNKQIGKQADEAAARATLHALAGQTNIVTTSVVLVCKELQLEDVRADAARVTFKPLDEAAVERYLQSGDWHDKAGYGIQSGAAPLIASIGGDYTTILGLPTTLLAEMLSAQGVPAHPVHLTAPVPTSS